jgi:hypothetical protein
VSDTAKVVYWCVWLVSMAIVFLVSAALLAKIGLAAVVSVILLLCARFAERRNLWPD